LVSTDYLEGPFKGSIYPNPDIEMRFIVQVIDVHRKVIKTVVTLLVMRLFEALHRLGE